MKKLILAISLFSIIAIGSIYGQTPVLTEYSEDYQGVEAAILDYVEGIYEVDPARIERSVHPDLRKRGYGYYEKNKSYRDNLDMTFEELKEQAATWNKDGKNANKYSVKKIEIFDIHDKTASGKSVTEWGIDFFHLAKIDGKWVIMNVLWQSHNE